MTMVQWWCSGVMLRCNFDRPSRRQAAATAADSPSGAAQRAPRPQNDPHAARRQCTTSQFDRTC